MKQLVLKGIASLLDQREDRPRRRLQAPILASANSGSLDLDNGKIYELIDLP